MTNPIMNADSQTPTQPTESTESIMSFWFRDEQTGRMDLPQSKRWFRGGKSLDTELAERFSAALSLAMQGRLDEWMENAEGTLALILLLDQFNRNIHRGTANAFAGDRKALALCHHAIDSGLADTLPLTQQVFCYMPLEHDESMASQDLSVALFTRLRDKAPESLREFASGTLDYALEHRKIIERFGRYPYRNEALGRSNTAEELAWLSESNQRFGQ